MVEVVTKLKAVEPGAWCRGCVWIVGRLLATGTVPVERTTHARPPSPPRAVRSTSSCFAPGGDEGAKTERYAQTAIAAARLDALPAVMQRPCGAEHQHRKGALDEGGWPARIMPARSMKYRLPQLGVSVVAAAFLGYWALLVYCDVWRPIPLGLFLRFDADRSLVVDTVPDGPAQRAGLRAGDRISRLRRSPDRQPPRLDDGRNQPRNRAADAADRRARRCGIGRCRSHPSSRRGRRGAHGRDRRFSWCAQPSSWRCCSACRGGVQALERFDGARRLGLSRHHRRVLADAAVPVCVGVARPAAPAGLLLWIPFLSSVAIAAWAFSFFVMFPRVRFRTPLAWCAIWIPIVPGLVGQAVFGYYTVVLRQPAPPLPPWTQGLVDDRRRLRARRTGGARR